MTRTAEEKRKPFIAARFIVICIVAFLVMEPLLWMVSSSFKPEPDIFRYMGLIPYRVTLENYVKGWQGTGGMSFAVFFHNSIVLVVVAIVGSEGTEKAKGPAELRVAWWGATGRNVKYLKIIEEYQKRNPSVKIVPEYQGWSDYWSKMATLAAARNLPDVHQYTNNQLGEYHAKGAVTSLEPYVKSGVIKLDDWNKSMVDSGRIIGELAAITIGITGPAMIFNVTWMEELGVKNAMLTTAVGSLMKLVIHKPTDLSAAVDAFATIEEAMEICLLIGSVIGGEPHFHIVAAGPKGLYAGHVKPDTRVLYMAVLTLTEIEGVDLERRLSRENVKKIFPAGAPPRMKTENRYDGAVLSAVLPGFFPESVRGAAALASAVELYAEGGFGCVEFYYAGPEKNAAAAVLRDSGLASIFLPAYPMKRDRIDLGAPGQTERGRSGYGSRPSITAASPSSSWDRCGGASPWRRKWEKFTKISGSSST